MSRIGTVFLFFIISGCASNHVDTAGVTAKMLFEDSLFATERMSEVESSEEVFALSEEAKAFVDAAVENAPDQAEKIDHLVFAVFDRSHLGLEYSNQKTSTASDTFKSGLANCLSMTIMTYSMADYAGLKAQFLSVDVPEYWTRRQGFSLLNGHVNLSLKAEYSPLSLQLNTRNTVVDFDPQETRRFFRSHPVNKQYIMALFYNNRAADAIIAEDFDLAYNYLKAAAKKSPLVDDTWVNLGVLYRLTGEYKRAEMAYQHAAGLRPQNYTIYENLAILYRLTGQLELADELGQRVAIARRDNPFYHFILAEEAKSNGDFSQALSSYQKAIRLDNTRHEFLFGIGVTLYELGDIGKAQHYLTRAAKHAPSEEDRARYASKLSVMQTRLK